MTNPVAPKFVPTVIFDYEVVNRFLRSVAASTALQRHTSMEWVEYNDSTFLNAVYTLYFWKGKPGWVEVKQSDISRIRATIDQHHEMYMNQWVKRLMERGPQAAYAYIKQLHQLRENARHAVAEIFRSAQKINSEVIGEVNSSIKKLAAIKLTAQIGIAVIGAGAALTIASGAAVVSVGGASMSLGAGGTAFTAVGLGNSYALSLIKNWESSNNAVVAAVDIKTDVGKATTGAIADKAIDHYKGKALEQITKGDHLLKTGKGQIKAASKKMARQIVSKRRMAAYVSQRKAGQKVVERGMQQKAAGQATQGLLKTVGKAIPIVFAAHDIYNAFVDYNDTVSKAR